MIQSLVDNDLLFIVTWWETVIVFEILPQILLYLKFNCDIGPHLIDKNIVSASCWYSSTILYLEPCIWNKFPDEQLKYFKKYLGERNNNVIQNTIYWFILDEVMLHVHNFPL